MEKIKKIFLCAVLFYGILYLIISEQFANVTLIIFTMSYIFLYFLKSIFAKFLYKYSSRFVEKKYISSHNTLKNSHCVVRYYPGEKLSVTDNLNNEQRCEKRIFTIYKYNGAPVDKCWNEICSIFDDYTYFDSLSAFVSKTTPIKIKLLTTSSCEEKDMCDKYDFSKAISEKNIQNNEKNDETVSESKNAESEFISMDEVFPDTFGVEGSTTNVNENYFVDMDSIRKVGDEN